MRHATAVLAVLAVCCIQIPSSVSPDYLGDATAAMAGTVCVKADTIRVRLRGSRAPLVVILPPIWILLSLISVIKLLFSLVTVLKVRRDRTQYPRQNRVGGVGAVLSLRSTDVVTLR